MLFVVTVAVSCGNRYFAVAVAVAVAVVAIVVVVGWFVSWLYI